MINTFSTFDTSIKDLIQYMFSGKVIISPVDEAFDYAFKQTSGDVKFPFISLYRNPNITIDDKNNGIDQFHDGESIQNPMIIYNEDGSIKGTTDKLAKNQHSLYIILEYQVEVWATTKKDVEQATQELIFWLKENQQVSANIMGDDLTFSFNMDPQIVDNSDLSLYNSQGKIYRYTLSISMQGVLFRTKNFFTLIHPDVKIKEV
jgi:hypothetical protein